MVAVFEPPDRCVSRHFDADELVDDLFARGNAKAMRDSALGHLCDMLLQLSVFLPGAGNSGSLRGRRAIDSIQLGGNQTSLVASAIKMDTHNCRLGVGRGRLCAAVHPAAGELVVRWQISPPEWLP